LIDEISVLIYPAIDGLSGVPSIFEFAGRPDEKPADGQALRHVGTETLDGGMVWLRYRVEDSNGSSRS
jgi:riboflavin biosynthesis pyrimidine reductase